MYFTQRTSLKPKFFGAQAKAANFLTCSCTGLRTEMFYPTKF